MNSICFDFILLIPCYNNEKGLIDSIKSIHYPSEKFEILIVDDGSASPIVNVKKLFPNYNIQILRSENNKGILNALNTGLNHLKNRNDYKYIARLDAGDICNTERFNKQVNFLDTRTNVFILGTWCTFKTIESGKTFEYITQTEHVNILKEMHYKCSFIHPTVMFKREVLNTIGLYPSNFPHAEDYAYFWEILKKHEGAVLPEVLVTIAVNDSNVSSKNYKTQLKSRSAIVKHYGTNAIDKAMGLFLLFCKRIMPGALIDRIKFK